VSKEWFIVPGTCTSCLSETLNNSTTREVFLFMGMVRENSVLLIYNRKIVEIVSSDIQSVSLTDCDLCLIVKHCFGSTNDL